VAAAVELVAAAVVMAMLATQEYRKTPVVVEVEVAVYSPELGARLANEQVTTFQLVAQVDRPTEVVVEPPLAPAAGVVVDGALLVALLIPAFLVPLAAKL
jgi:hypothetical protein